MSSCFKNVGVYIESYDKFSILLDILNPKTDLILGCTGQDGSLLCKSLLEKGNKVIGLSRRGKKKIKNHIRLQIEKDIEVLEGDITNFETIERLIVEYQPGRIYNLAAQSSVGQSINEPINAINGIVNGTLNILEVCRKLNYQGKLFFAGSSEMFGNTESRANINHIQKPISPYGIGKQASFNLVKMYRKLHKLKSITGVLFNHESHLRNENFVTQKIIKGVSLIKRKKMKQLRLGNIEVIRDWGWAPEYIEAMQLMANSNDLKDHIICSGSSNSLQVFIEQVFIAYNLDWKEHVVIDKTLIRSSEIKESYGDPEPLFKDLGWKAKENLSSLINKLIDENKKIDNC